MSSSCSCKGSSTSDRFRSVRTSCWCCCRGWYRFGTFARWNRLYKRSNKGCSRSSLLAPSRQPPWSREESPSSKWSSCCSFWTVAPQTKWFVARGSVDSASAAGRSVLSVSARPLSSIRSGKTLPRFGDFAAIPHKGDGLSLRLIRTK